jgi:hypothetical protein
VDGVTDPDTEPLGVLDTQAMYGGSGMPTTVPHQQNALVGEEEPVALGDAERVADVDAAPAAQSWIARMRPA